MGKNLELTLDFLVNIKNDKTKLDQLVKEVESVLKAVNPKLDFSGNEVKKGISEIVNYLSTAGNGVQDLQKLFDSLDIDSEGLQKELKKVEQTLENIDQVDLDNLNNSFEKAENHSKSLVDKLASLGLAINGIEQITGTLEQLQKPYVALDTATQQLKSLGDEAAQMAPDLRDAAISMSKDLPFAAAELQGTMFDALASGVQGGVDGIKVFADTAAKLATGGGAKISEATALIAGQLNAYGKSAEEAGKFADIFFNTVNYGVTTIPELSSTLANVVPTASALEVELENVGAALAVMTAKGIPTAQSTTKLNALLIEIAKPGAALAPILDKAGVSLESLKKDDLPVTLDKINKALQETGKASVEVFSSSEAGAAFASLAGDIDYFSKTFDDVKNTTGSAENAYTEMADSIEVRTKQIQTQVESFFIGVFDTFGDTFTVITQVSTQLAPVATSLVGLGQMIPIAPLKTFATTLLTSVVPATSATGISIGAMMLPITGVIAGLAGLYLFFTKTEKGREIAEQIGTAFQNLWEKLAPVFDSIVDVGGKTFDAFVEIGKVIFEWIISPFEIVGAVMQGLIAWFGELFGTSSKGTDIFKNLSKTFAKVGDAMVAVGKNAKTVGEWIAYTKQIVFNFIKEAPELFSVLFDYAKYYLNPANWISGDDALEKKLKSRLDTVVKKITDVKPKVDIKTEVDKKSADEAVKVAAETQKKIGKEEGKAGKAKKEKQESAVELARKEYDLTKAKSEVELKQFELMQNEQILREGRKRDLGDDLVLEAKKLELAEKQKLAWFDIYKQKGLIKSIDKDGNLIFTAKIKSEADKTSLQATFTELNTKVIDENSKLETLKIKVQLDKAEIEKRVSELEKQKIDWEIQVGIRSQDFNSNIEELKTKLDKTKSDLENNEVSQIKLKAKIDTETDNTLKLALQNELNNLQKQNSEIRNQEFNLNKQLFEIEDKAYKSRLDLLKEAQAKKEKTLEEQANNELGILNNFNQRFYEATQRQLDNDKNADLNKIGTKKDKELEELEKLKEREIIAEETFNEKKKELDDKYEKEKAIAQEKYRKKQLIADAQAKGLEMELERRKAEQTLNLQKDNLNEQLKLLASKAKSFDEAGNPVFRTQEDAKAYQALEEQLTKTEDLLSQKGDSIGLLVSELQGTVTDSITNLFAGDADAIADSWRQMFAQLAAMLQAKASAFALDLILSKGTVDYLSALPFPLNVISIPVITATINSAVKAVTNPILNEILSFSTGGRIDQPTLAMIGDGARLGGKNREWIFNDSQLIATVQMASLGGNTLLINKLDRLEKLLASQSIETRISGQDILISQKRAIHANNIRKR